MRDAVAAHLGSHQVSRVLHGSIIGLALVVALEEHPPRAAAIVATLLATAVAFGLAEIYAEYVGTETRTRARVGAEQMRAIWGDALAIAFGVAFPAVFFVLAAVTSLGLDSAFDIAKWSGLALIAAYGFAAAQLTGAGLAQSIRRASIAGLIGAFLIIIKALVH